MTVTVRNPLSRWRLGITFRFDNYAWIVMCDALGIELHDIGKVEEKKLLVYMIYGAYVSHCRYTVRRERYTVTDIYKMFAKMTVEDVERIKLAMLQSRILGKTVMEWGLQAEGEKKK